MPPTTFDIVSYIQYYYDSTTYAGLIIAYDSSCPIKHVGYGIIFQEQRQTFVPENINAPWGADHYNVYIIGNSRSQIEAIARHMITLFNSTMDMTLNTSYAQFWLDYDNAQWLKSWEDRPINENWRKIANCSVWCSKREHTGQQILDPRYNTRLGGD